MLARCAQWMKAVPELPRVFVVPERKGCQGVGAAHSEARTRPLDAPEVTQTLRGWGAGIRPKAESPAPLTTEGDSLPSLARGGGEWSRAACPGAFICAHYYVVTDPSWPGAGLVTIQIVVL